MSKDLTCRDVIDAAKASMEWPAFVEGWADEAITRAMGTIVEARKSATVTRDDPAPLPPYAVKRVRAAVTHINGVAVRCERQLERFGRDRKRPAPV